MLAKGQRIVIAQTIKTSWLLRRIRKIVAGKYARIAGQCPSDPDYYYLDEFPGYVFHEKYLLPTDDNDRAAFDRFLNKLDLTKGRNEWTT